MNDGTKLPPPPNSSTEGGETDKGHTTWKHSWNDTNRSNMYGETTRNDVF